LKKLEERYPNGLDANASMLRQNYDIEKRENND
jgi:hypothetical protein